MAAMDGARRPLPALGGPANPTHLGWRMTRAMLTPLIVHLIVPRPTWKPAHGDRAHGLKVLDDPLLPSRTGRHLPLQPVALALASRRTVSGGALTVTNV